MKNTFKKVSQNGGLKGGKAPIKTPPRTEEQAKKHKEYMRNYFKNNPEKKQKNNERNKKRGLEKIKCIHCEKMITRVNMKRHEKVKHSFKKELQNGGSKGGKAPISQEGGE